MSTPFKKLLLAAALALGLSAAGPAVAQEATEGTEQGTEEIEPIPPEETGEVTAPEEAPEEAPAEEGTEAPAPEEGTEAAPE